MRYFLLSDSADAMIGMRLAGVEGILVQTEREVREATLWVRSQPDIGVLLITEGLGRLCPDLVYDLKLHASRPLLIEIPDRHGTGRTPDSITRYVSEAIGVKVE